MPRVNTKILTTGIRVVFRGLKFESDADIGGKDSFRSGTIYNQASLCVKFTSNKHLKEAKNVP